MAVAVTLCKYLLIGCAAYFVIKKAVKDALKEFHNERDT